MASKFVYKSLNNPAKEIRLLQIAPDEPLRCHISIHQRDCAPEYRAISYTWGDQDPTYTVLIDDQAFAARKNCECVLRQARQHLSEETYIWLDAICINQNDNEEKSKQVAAMGAIYWKAKSVFVSLGEAYDDSDHLYDMARFFHDRRDTECNDCIIRKSDWRSYEWDTAKERVSHGYHTWVEEVDNGDFSRLEAAFSSFVDRPYWCRMWIIQETLRAREIDVACGSQLVSIEKLQAFIHIFAQVYKDRVILVGAPFETRLEIKSEFFRRTLSRYRTALENSVEPQVFEFAGFVADLAGYGCADIRDRIYALLGLVDWRSDGPPEADYRINPLALAVDVHQRINTDNDVHPIHFPHKLSDLLHALDIKATCEYEREVPEKVPCNRPNRTVKKCECHAVILPHISSVHVENERFLFSSRSLASVRTSLLPSAVEPCPQRRSNSPIACSRQSSKENQRPRTLCARKLFSRRSWKDFLISPPTPSICDERSAPSAESSREGRVSRGHDASAQIRSASGTPTMGRSQSMCDEVKRLGVVHDLQEEDILVNLDGYKAHHAEDFVFCLVLRKAFDDYYEILDEAPLVRNGVFDPSQDAETAATWYGPPPILCLDSSDAVSLTLSLDRLKARFNAGQMVDAERQSLFDSSHARAKMSSYAIVAEISKLRLSKVMGVPSRDGRSVPCAKCGGRFEPTDAMAAKYKPKAAYGQFKASQSLSGKEAALVRYKKWRQDMKSRTSTFGDVFSSRSKAA